MSPSLLPPNPCLVAILLVVNYHHQPRLVFHYPPKPGEDNSHFRTYFSDDLSDDDSSSSGEDASASSDDSRSSADRRTQHEKGRNIDIGEVDIEELGSVSPEKLDGMAQIRKPPKWNDIFGIEAMSLAKLLSPAPACHKKRFEMTLDEKAFLGWPVFSKDGRWRKRKVKKSRSRIISLQDDSAEKSGQWGLPGEQSPYANTELGDTSGQDTGGDDEVRHGMSDERVPSKRPMSKAGSGKPSDESNKRLQSSDEDKVLDTLKMFHIVFVLDPPPLEYHLRTKEMYDHVIKKFSRALRWEQARSNYVSKETSNILAAKRVGKSLSKAIGNE
jgi:nitrogen permease regulator 3-like protein